MEKIKIYEPQAVSYSITIAIPISKSIVVFNGKNISDWEKIFTTLIDNVDLSNRKLEYVRCIALLKWASDCNASLVNVANSDNESNKTVEFTFAFSNLDSMCSFEKDFKTRLKEYTIF